MLQKHLLIRQRLKLNLDSRDPLLLPQLRAPPRIAALPPLQSLRIRPAAQRHIKPLHFDPLLGLVPDQDGGVGPAEAKGEVSFFEVGRVLDHGEDGAVALVVGPETQVFEPAELFLEGEGVGDDVVVEAEGAPGFEGVEEAFAHQGVLELNGSSFVFEYVIDPGCAGYIERLVFWRDAVKFKLRGDADHYLLYVAP